MANLSAEVVVTFIDNEEVEAKIQSLCQKLDTDRETIIQLAVDFLDRELTMTMMTN